MAASAPKTSLPAAHVKLQLQANLVSLLHQREEARLKFHDLNHQITNALARASESVQDAFFATEKLYRLPVPDPEEQETLRPKRALERLDVLVEQEEKKKPRKEKSLVQKERAKAKLQAFKTRIQQKKISDLKDYALMSLAADEVDLSPLKPVDAPKKKRKTDQPLV